MEERRNRGARGEPGMGCRQRWPGSIWRGCGGRVASEVERTRAEAQMGDRAAANLRGEGVWRRIAGETGEGAGGRERGHTCVRRRGAPDGRVPSLLLPRLQHPHSTRKERRCETFPAPEQQGSKLCSAAGLRVSWAVCDGYIRFSRPSWAARSREVAGELFFFSMY
jgi:hypothetical protein